MGRIAWKVWSSGPTLRVANIMPLLGRNNEKNGQDKFFTVHEHKIVVSFGIFQSGNRSSSGKQRAGIVIKSLGVGWERD